jgi:hypothetical protein
MTNKKPITEYDLSKWDAEAERYHRRQMLFFWAVMLLLAAAILAHFIDIPVHGQTGAFDPRSDAYAEGCP